jgi:NAD(P)H-nitrite reductase large subunit
MLHEKPTTRPADSAGAFDPYGTFKLPSVTPRSRATSGNDDAARANASTMQRGRADIVIVGNGVAGCVAAMEARSHAPDAEIVIVTEQNHPTINTPALKQFGAGRLELDQLLFQSPGAERRLRIGVLNQRVERLEPRTRQLILRGGERLTYGRLLLATGSKPIGLASLPGAGFDGVVVLHTLAQYLDLRRRIHTTTQAIVLGGGYHAAETALLLRHSGLAVTWLIRGRGMLSGTLDAAASDLVCQYVRKQDIDVRLATEAAGIVGRMGVAAGVLTTADEFLPGQLIVAAVGVQPELALARDAGLPAATTGLPVNACMQTQTAAIFAAGAVASVVDPQTRERASRAQWYFAVQQGRLAGAALAGASTRAGAEISAIGAFWHATQLGKVRVLTAGAPALADRDRADYVALTNGSASCYRRVVLRDDRLVGYVAVGERVPSGLAIKRIIDEALPVGTVIRDLLSAEFDARAFLNAHRLDRLDASADLAGAALLSEHPLPSRSA